MAEPARKPFGSFAPASAVKLDAKRPLVGLAENAKGVSFQCGTCEYFESGVCRNKDPELDGRKVKPEWCCDLYDHSGMRTIVG